MKIEIVIKSLDIKNSSLKLSTDFKKIFEKVKDKVPNIDEFKVLSEKESSEGVKFGLFIPNNSKYFLLGVHIKEVTVGKDIKYIPEDSYEANLVEVEPNHEIFTKSSMVSEHKLIMFCDSSDPQDVEKKVNQMIEWVKSIILK